MMQELTLSVINRGVFRWERQASVSRQIELHPPQVAVGSDPDEYSALVLSVIVALDEALIVRVDCGQRRGDEKLTEPRGVQGRVFIVRAEVGCRV